MDRRKYDLDKAMAFLKGFDIAPVFYISGNHEAWSGKYSTIKKELEDAGVHVLDNDVIRLSIGVARYICLCKGPDFHTSNYLEGTDITEMTDQFKQWSTYKGFKILLSHRPELFDLYCENKMDLIFTGHAHGDRYEFLL